MTSQEKKKYSCYYCAKKISLKELKEVDFEMQNIEEEELEFILDELPKLERKREAPFIHKTGKNTQVLNICRETLNCAIKKYLEKNGLESL